MKQNILPKLNTHDYKPLYIQLSEILADWIQKKRLSPGEKLPSENELIERHGISRMTVRLAIQRLEAADLVSKVQGKGTFVSDSVFRRDVQGFKNIEEHMAELGIQVINVLLESHEIYSPQDLKTDLNLAKNSKAWIIRRLKMAEEEPFAVETRYLPLDIAKRYSNAELEKEPIFRLLLSYPDSQIHKVSYSVGCRFGSNQETKCLKVPPKTPVLVRKGIYKNQQGKPLMVSRVVFLANKFELQYIFHLHEGKWQIAQAR